MKRVLILIMALLLLGCASKEEQIENYLKSQGFSGSIMVTKGGKEIYKGAMGYSDYENKIKNQVDTRYLIGSMSKPLTALAVMNLVEEGKVEVEDRLSKYLEFPNSNEISIKQLLTQTSGYDRYVELYLNDDGSLGIKLPKGLELGMVFVSTEEVVQMISETNYRADKDFRYSNLNYVLLARVIEVASGMSYKEYVEEFYTSIGMDNSGLEYNYWQDLDNRALAYLDSSYTTLAPRDNLSKINGAGALYSNVEDLTLLFEGIKNKSIVNEELLNQVSAKHANIVEEAAWLGKNYGYGFIIGEDTLSHPGSLFGFEARMYFDMANDISIVILTNTSSTRVQGIEKYIREILI